MPHSSARWHTLLLYFLPFNTHNFTLAHDRFEVFELILELTCAILPSEEVNSIQYGITHPGDILTQIIFLFCLLYRACGLLHHRVHILLAKNPWPVVVFKVEVNHVICYRPVLILSAKYYHRRTVNRTAMVFPWLHADAFGFHNIESSQHWIKHHYLRVTLSHLPLAVVHVWASEAVNFTVVNTWGMSAPTKNLFDWIGWWVFHVSPLRQCLVIYWRWWYV